MLIIMADMENPEGLEGDKEALGFGRRKFLRTLGGVGTALFCAGIPGVSAQYSPGDSGPSLYGERWYFTFEEMQQVYDREYNGEKPLKNCFQEKAGNVIGTVGGEEFIVPRMFIDRVLDHLTQMLEIGAARLLFRLDAFHGHPYMDKKLWVQRYGTALLDVAKETQILVTDRDVEILYHNAEHLDPNDNNPQTRSFVKKRNAIGRTKGAPIELLALPEEIGEIGMARSTPEEATDFRAMLRFAAHKDGVFAIRVGNKEIRLDLSLDDNSYS